MPRELGEYNGEALSVGAGRFGPYVKIGEAFVSIPRNIDPLEISVEQAIQLVKEKQAEDAPIGHYKELPITKGKGRFGPFIKWNGMFINVPRRIDFQK